MKRLIYLGGVCVVLVLFILISGCGMEEVEEVQNKERNKIQEEDMAQEDRIQAPPNDEHYQNQLVSSIDKLALIRDVFVEKYEVESSHVGLSFREDAGDHLVGMVSLSDYPGESGIFYATKVGDQWVVVWDGNGLPNCSELEKYGFPDTMMEECNDGPKRMDELQDEMDEVEGIVGGLLAMSSIQFLNLDKNAEFIWMDGGEIKTLVGIKIEATDIPGSYSDTSVITNYLENLGFEFDPMNITEGTVVGSVGYKRDSIVCRVRSKYYQETDMSDMWLACGLLK